MPRHRDIAIGKLPGDFRKFVFQNGSFGDYGALFGDPPAPN